jgi:hypothetical protein
MPHANGTSPKQIISDTDSATLSCILDLDLSAVCMPHANGTNRKHIHNLQSIAVHSVYNLQPNHPFPIEH